MYIFSVAFGLTHLFNNQSVMEAIMICFFTEYLPPASIEDVIAQGFIGSVAVGCLWYWKTPF